MIFPEVVRVVSEDQARTLTAGYYACISYIDALVGRLLDAIDRLGLREKTVIVLWSDHGFHLGKNGMWCKQTNTELSTRSVLIVSVPGQKSTGRKTEALVELVDTAPSLYDICGLPPIQGLEGVTFEPLLKQLDRRRCQVKVGQISPGQKTPQLCSAQWAQVTHLQSAKARSRSRR